MMILRSNIAYRRNLEDISEEVKPDAGFIAYAANDLYRTIWDVCANATAGTLKDCTNSGNIFFNTPRAKGDPCKFFVAGGIAGENAMDIIGCSNSGNILSESNVKQHILFIVSLYDRTEQKSTDSWHYKKV